MSTSQVSSNETLVIENLNPFDAFMARTKLEIQQIADHSQTILANRSEEWEYRERTLMAIKDDTSYLIIRPELQVNFLVEKSKILVAEKTNRFMVTLFEGGQQCIVYSRRCNSYFMVLDRGKMICRKDIDKKPFYPYIYLNIEYGIKKSLYSELNERFILYSSSGVVLPTNQFSVLFVNPRTKRTEYSFFHKGNNQIREFCLLPPDETKLLMLDKRFRVLIYGVFTSHGSRTELSRSLELERVILGQPYRSLCLEMVPSYFKDRALVIIQVEIDYFSVTLFTVEVQNGKILNVVMPEKGESFSSQKVRNLQCCGCVDDHLLFVTYLWGKNAQLFIEFFGYDLSKNMIKRLDEHSLRCVDEYPSRLFKSRDNFYYVAKSGKVYKIVKSNC